MAKTETDILKGFKRLSGFPLDKTCIASTFTKALEYSRTAVAYPGQIIIVLNDDNPDELVKQFKDTTVPYVIDYSKRLVPLNKDAYFVRNEVINKITELTNLINDNRSELLNVIDTYKYVNKSEIRHFPTSTQTVGLTEVNDEGLIVPVYKKDQEGNLILDELSQPIQETTNITVPANINYVFSYGDNSEETLTTKFDPIYFELENNLTTGWILSFNETIKNRIRQITTNEENISDLYEKLDEEITRASDEENRIDDKLDEEITTRTSDVNILTSNLNAEVERATNTESNLQEQISSNDSDISSIFEHNRTQDINVDNRLHYSDINNKPLTTDRYVNVGDCDIDINVVTKNAVTLTETRPISTDIFGIKTGTILSNSDVLDTLNTLLHPTVKPDMYINSITIGSNGSLNNSDINVITYSNAANMIINISWITRSDDIYSFVVKLNNENINAVLEDRIMNIVNVKENSQLTLRINNLTKNTVNELEIIAVDSELNELNSVKAKFVLSEALVISKLRANSRLDRFLTDMEVDIAKTNVNILTFNDNTLVTSLFNKSLLYEDDLDSEAIVIFSPVELTSIIDVEHSMNILNAFEHGIYLVDNKYYNIYHSDPIYGHIKLNIQ